MGNNINRRKNIGGFMRKYYLQFIVFFISHLLFSCVSQGQYSINNSNDQYTANQKPPHLKGWEEVDRINLKYYIDITELDDNYDEIENEETKKAIQSLAEAIKELHYNIQFTDDEGFLTMLKIFADYFKTAHLIKFSTNVHLNTNKDHQLVIYRKWDGTEYVKFWIYKLEIIYRNYTIYYDFISDDRRGASFYGNDNGYFNLYNQDIDSFFLIIDAEKRILINKLSKSNDPFILGQAETIKYSLENDTYRYFF